MTRVKTAEENYQELRNDPQEFRNQLPDMFHMTVRFEKCRTISDVIVVLVGNLDWDESTMKSAYWEINRRFGHLSDDEVVDVDNETIELKNEIKGLKMAKGKLEVQVKKLKEK